MKDFLWNELSVGDKVAYISTKNKQSLEIGVVYSIWQVDRLHVNRWTTPIEDLLKCKRSQLWWLEFKWNT